MVEVAATDSLRLESFSPYVSSNLPMLLAGGLVIAIALDWLMTPSHASSEPRLVKPSIPWIGHIIGMLRKQGAFHHYIRKKQPGASVVSLQVLWDKQYNIWEPSLAHAALTSRGLSFEPLMEQMSGKMMNFPLQHHLQEYPNLMVDFINVISASMQPKFLYPMSNRALGYISSTLDDIGADGGLELPNLYLWVRNVVTIATTRALFGKENPYEKIPSATEDLWCIEANMQALAVTPFPAVFVREAHQARKRLQRIFGEYFEAGHDTKDPTVSELARSRARVLRQNGITPKEVGLWEFMLPVLAMTNTVPAMFWMIYFMFSTPGLADSIREEVAPLLTRKPDDPDTITLDIKRFEAECPLLNSTWMETLRIRNEVVSHRMTISDTVLEDSRGTSYVLKKGHDVAIPTGLYHLNKDVWGEDVGEFKPERFLAGGKGTAKQLERRNTAYIPFGGGRHLCPGRMFAYAEILGTAAALVTGFEMDATGPKNFGEVESRPHVGLDGVAKPMDMGEGFGARISRKKGWEKTKWRFSC